MISPLRLLYLGLALLGVVHPLVYFLSGASDSIAGMVPDAWPLHAAPPPMGWDLTIAAITLTVWIIAETTVRRNWQALLAIPATFLIGLSCGLPLYLFLRTRPVS